MDADNVNYSELHNSVTDSYISLGLFFLGFTDLHFVSAQN